MTAADPIETIEGRILRVLRDGGQPVPLTDLDAVGGSREVAAALARLTRTGIVDVVSGYASVNVAHLMQTPAAPIGRPAASTAASTVVGWNAGATGTAPKPAPPVSAVLAQVLEVLAKGPLSRAALVDQMPEAMWPLLDSAISLGTATGRLGQRTECGEQTVFVPSDAGGRDGQSGRGGAAGGLTGRRRVRPRGG